MRSTRLLAVPVVALSVLAVSACGSTAAPTAQSAAATSPKDAVSTALAATSKQSTATATIRLTGSGAVQQGVDLSRLSLVVGSDRAAQRIEAKLMDGATVLEDVVADKQQIAAQFDIKKIAAMSGASAGDLSQITGAKAQLEQSIPGAGALLDGKWVSLSLTDLQGIEKQMSKGGGTDVTGGLQDPAALAKKVDQLRTDLSAQATVVRDAKDPNHYTVTLAPKDLVADLSKLAPTAQQLTAKDLAGAPKTVSFELTVADGAVTKLSADLSQLGKDAPKVTLEATFAKGATFTTPASPTKLDLSKAFQMFGAQLGAAGSAG